MNEQLRATLQDEERRLMAEQAAINARLRAIRTLLRDDASFRTRIRGSSLSRGSFGWSKLVIDGSVEYLREKRSRATAKEIWEALERQGIRAPKGTTLPNRQLSAVLSSCPLFDNDRGEGGYGLVNNWQSLNEERSSERA